MTQEEKAKRYDEALKYAMIYYKDGNEDMKMMMKTCFPVLVEESEDEKIRKELIDFVKSRLAGFPDCKRFTDWLEKQGKTFTKKDVDDAYLKGICDAKHELEKQGEPSIKWNKNTEGNKPQVNHSVLMKTTHGIAEGEWQGEYWHQYRWAGIVRDSDVLSWVELSDLEKQGNNMGISEAIKKKLEDNLNKALEKETPESWNKFLDEKGEQNPAWSEEDEDTIKFLISHFCVSHCNRSFQFLNKIITHDELLEKIRNLRPQKQWKPSDEQMDALENAIIDSISSIQKHSLESLYNELKKL